MKISTKIIVSFFLITSFIVLTSASLLRHTQLPVSAHTGAPGETTCATGNGCHTSSPLNSGNGTLTLTFQDPNDIYTPGFTYNMSVTLTDATKTKFGFEILCLNSSNANCGTFVVTNGANTAIQTVGTKKYMGHAHAGGTNTWNFKWTAPATNIGDIKFYLAGCAANHDSASGGDLVYSLIRTITPSSASVSNSTFGVESVSVYPTIISKNFAVEFNAQSSGSLVSELYDLNGKKVQSFSNEQINAGGNKFYFELNNSISPGIYLLNILLNDEKTTQRIIVQ